MSSFDEETMPPSGSTDTNEDEEEDKNDSISIFSDYVAANEGRSVEDNDEDFASDLETTTTAKTTTTNNNIDNKNKNKKSNKKNNDFSDWWPKYDDDSFQTYLVEGTVSELNFGPLWTILHKRLGWKYRSSTGEYSAPDFVLSWRTDEDGVHRAVDVDASAGRVADPDLAFVFPSSIALQRALDDPEGHAAGEDRVRRLRALRDDVLKSMYVEERRARWAKHGGVATEEKETKTREKRGADVAVPYDDAIEEEDDDDGHEGLLSPAATRCFTSTEDGAETYFHNQKSTLKKSRKKRKITRRSSSASSLKSPTSLFPDKDDETTTNNATTGETTTNEPTDKPVVPDKLRPFPSAHDAVTAVINDPPDPASEAESARSEAVCATRFAEWRFQLDRQHSLLLYGFGSKKKLLETFSREELRPHGDVVHFDGFDAEIRLNPLLDVLSHTFLRGREEPPDDDDFPRHVPPELRRATTIARALRNRTRPIYVVLHNVDGRGLRHRTAQVSLAALVRHSRADGEGDNTATAIRLAASVDNVNAAFALWDRRTVEDFAWMWEPANTYRPYHEELLRCGGSLVPATVTNKTVRARAARDLGLKHVLTSLAPRHAEALRELAALQQKRVPEADGDGESESDVVVPYVELLEACRGKMIVITDVQLRNILRELADHKVMESRLDGRGREMLTIVHDRDPNALRTVLEFRR